MLDRFNKRGEKYKRDIQTHNSRKKTQTKPWWKKKKGKRKRQTVIHKTQNIELDWATRSTSKQHISFKPKSILNVVWGAHDYITSVVFCFQRVKFYQDSYIHSTYHYILLWLTVSETIHKTFSSLSCYWCFGTGNNIYYLFPPLYRLFYSYWCIPLNFV